MGGERWRGRRGRVGVVRVNAVVGVLLAVGLQGATAAAQSEVRTVAIGVAPHLLVGVSDACARSDDVIECSSIWPFAGADVSVHWWPAEYLAIGARVGLSKDLDAAESTDSDGLTFDPHDEYLWRFTAELRLDPPVLPAGLWVGAEVGLAVLRELDVHRVGPAGLAEDAVTRAAPLAGLGVGWDFWLFDFLTLTPELRALMIFMGDPPEFRADVEARDYGSSTWVELGLRLAYVL